MCILRYLCLFQAYEWKTLFKICQNALKDVDEMLIQKRNGLYQDYDRHKIENAIIKAFEGIHETIHQQHLENILNDVEDQIQERISVEYIQDKVEEALIFNII